MAVEPLHLLDVHARAEAATRRGQDHDPGPWIRAGRGDGGRQVVPALSGQRVDRREVDDHLGDPVARLNVDAHWLLTATPPPLQPQSTTF